MELQRYIDHSLLLPTANTANVITYCNQALTHGFFAVCLHGAFVSQAAELLAESNTKLAAVVGFPLGANSSQVKVFEAKNYVQNGAQEIDMVMNLSWFLQGKHQRVADEIKSVKQAIGNTVLKVIIETAYLTDSQKRMAASYVAQGEADYVKSSTGFGPGGATVEDIKLLFKEVGDSLGIKASGGIKTRTAALAMINAGATRIGTSNGVALL